MTRGTAEQARVRRAAILRAVQADPTRTLESFGQQFGVTRERIRQIVTGTFGTPKPHSASFGAAEKKARQEQMRERKKRARHTYHKDNARTVIALQQVGMTWEEIARALGVSFQTVARRFRDARAFNLPGCGVATCGTRAAKANARLAA